MPVPPIYTDTEYGKVNSQVKTQNIIQLELSELFELFEMFELFELFEMFKNCLKFLKITWYNLKSLTILKNLLNSLKIH